MGHSAGPAWERLRRVLVTRRVQLDPAYANRGVFARSEGVKVSYAVIRDLETGARVNFDPATLALADASYRYAAGSIQRVISGGDPLPLEDIREEPPGEPAEAQQEHRTYDDPTLEYLWRTPGLSEGQRKTLVDIVAGMDAWAVRRRTGT